MKALFDDWFSYNHETNKQFIEIFQHGETYPDQVDRIFSHILNAHQIWLQRIHPSGQNTPAPWADIAIEQFSAVNEQNLITTKIYLQSGDFGMHLGKTIQYQNTNGSRFENSIQEIYFHVLAHSAYHRGQIALLLRQAGFDPPVSDYIFHRREAI